MNYFFALLILLFSSAYANIMDDAKLLYEYQKAIENGNVDAYLNIGDIYNKQKNYLEALNWYHKYEKAAPEKVTPRFNNYVGLLYLNEFKQYDVAYDYFLKATKSGDYSTTSNLYHMVKNKQVPDKKKDEAIFWLEKSANSANNKNPDALRLSQELLYGYYLYDSNKRLKALELSKKAYDNGSIYFGCQLSAYYESYLNPNYDLEKAYDISILILKNNEITDDTSMCASSLASLYRSGNFVSKNPSKAIDILIDTFNKVSAYKKDHYASQIANIYLKDLHQYDEAEKWYQIAYDLTQEPEYLKKVDTYIKSLPEEVATTDSDAYTTQLFLDNLAKKEQIAAVLETEKYFFLATDQKTINIYDKTTLKLIKKLYGWAGKGSSGLTIQMTFDPQKEILYCANINSSSDLTRNGLIVGFDIHSGKIVSSIELPLIQITYMDITQNGKYLLIVRSKNIFDFINTSTKEIQTYYYSNITDFTQAIISQVSDDYIAKFLSADGYIYSFSINQKRQIKKEKTDQTNIFLKSFDGDRAVKIFNYNPELLKDAKLDNNRLLMQFNAEPVQRIFDFDKMSLESSGQIIKHSASLSRVDVKLINDNKTAQIYSNHKLISSISFMTEKVMQYKILDNKYVLITNPSWNMTYIFNLVGRPIARLTGFQSPQKNLIYENGKLITFGDDNILHIWNLSHLDEINEKKEEYDPIILQSFRKILNGDILELTRIPTKEYDEEWAPFFKQSLSIDFLPTKEEIKSYVKLFVLKKQDIYPSISLYVNQSDWIAFEHHGYFASSKGGMNLIKYRVNQGYDKEAKIVENSQIYEKFYRPDLIKKKLAKEPIDFDLNVADIITRINPPEVVVLKQKKIDDNNLEVTYKVCDRGSGVADATVLVNGISIKPSFTRGFSIEKLPTVTDDCVLYKNIITLKSGKNSIEFKAFDASKTISAKSDALIEMAKNKKENPSNLYFISIAIADYEDSALKLKFSVNDVLSVKDKIVHKGKTLFKNIYTYDLHNSSATKKDLDGLFTNLSKEIHPDDVLVVYFSGHGMTSNKDGLYYFYPYNLTDASHQGLVKNAISVNEIKNQLSKISAYNSLILFDTCDSGGVIDSVIDNQMLNRLSHDNSRNFIVASSRKQPALEGYRDHGVFTFVVLEAFDKAYSPTQSILTTSNLANYVETAVPKITFDNWHYEQIPQKYLSGEPFDIGVK